MIYQFLSPWLHFLAPVLETLGLCPAELPWSSWKCLSETSCHSNSSSAVPSLPLWIHSRLGAGVLSLLPRALPLSAFQACVVCLFLFLTRLWAPWVQLWVTCPTCCHPACGLLCRQNQLWLTECCLFTSPLEIPFCHVPSVVWLFMGCMDKCHPNRTWMTNQIKQTGKLTNQFYLGLVGWISEFEGVI